MVNRKRQRASKIIIEKGNRSSKKGNDYIRSFFISKNYYKEIFANKLVNLDDNDNFPDKYKLVEFHEKEIIIIK